MGDITQIFQSWFESYQVIVKHFYGVLIKTFRHLPHEWTSFFSKTDSPNCSIWALRKSALDSCETCNAHVVNAVSNKFYMVDYFDSFDNVDEAVTTIQT